ncbi:MAG: FAD-dependent thymidylate synthase [Patescibacteria group bacterium]
MANIFIYDEFNPEDVAMMQALYSRSPKSVTEHVEKVRQTGSGKFMETFYVGYGHASIADCGSTTIFIEQISILGDKAVQDWQLYSGQETSTRYIDMSKQAIVDPLQTPESKKILDAWMAFYIRNQDRIQQHLMAKYPRQEDEKESVYIKAIKARGFDIMRGFLPAGVTTQLSWHTNLRQAWDHLALLLHHPLTEVRTVAETIVRGLKKKYPHSFSHPTVPELEAYRDAAVKKYTYFQSKPAEFTMRTTVNADELTVYQSILDSRPVKTGLPNFLGDLGTLTFDFLLDFGSFRDIQRHRSGICRMPLLTTALGFRQWYLEQLPEDMRHEAEELIQKQKKAIDALSCPDEVRQYYVAMGFNVACHFTFPLPAAVYVTELRSNRTVHPTLRAVAHRMHQAISKAFPDLRLYSDLDPDDWDVRRGLADITSK